MIFDSFRSYFNASNFGANIRCSVTTIVSLVMVIFVVSTPCFAEIDFSVGGVTRTYPLSGVIEVESGLNGLLWGNSNDEIFGYVRAGVSGSTALTYNSIEGTVEVFPLSVLGVRAGIELSENQSDYRDFDCNSYECQGAQQKKFIEAQAVAGAWRWFLHFNVRNEDWAHKEKVGEPTRFVEPSLGVALSHNGERMRVYQGILGRAVGDQWKIMSVFRYAENESGTQVSRMPALMVKWSPAPVSFLVGCGVFSSTLKDANVSVFASLSYEFGSRL